MAKRVLLIDDEEEMVEMVSAGLTAAGYAMITAFESLQGIEQAKAEKPDVILLDIMMPGMNGFDVCRLMKVDPATKGIPILILTALGTKNLAEKCLAAGADDMLQKPWDATDLEGKIKALLKSS